MAESRPPEHLLGLLRVRDNSALSPANTASLRTFVAAHRAQIVAVSDTIEKLQQDTKANEANRRIAAVQAKKSKQRKTIETKAGNRFDKLVEEQKALEKEVAPYHKLLTWSPIRTIHSHPAVLLEIMYRATLAESLSGPQLPFRPVWVHNHSPLALAAVCRDWRKIVLANRHIWQHLDVFTTSVENKCRYPLGRVRSHIMHSVSIDLHVQLDLRHIPASSAFGQQLMMLVSSTSGRWSSLTLRWTADDYDTLETLSLLVTHPTHLHRLTLDGPLDTIASGSPLHLLTLAPNLKEACMTSSVPVLNHGASISSIRLAWHQLTGLALHGTTTMLLMILNTTQSITRCSLTILPQEVSSEQGHSESMVAPLPLSLLTYLHISTKDSLTSVDGLLARLACPHLQELVIPQPSTALSLFVVRSGCALKKLVVLAQSEADVDLSPTLELLRVCPQLLELSITMRRKTERGYYGPTHDSPLPFLRALAPIEAPPDGLLCPRLQILGLSPLRRVSTELERLLTARCAALLGVLQRVDIHDPRVCDDQEDTSGLVSRAYDPEDYRLFERAREAQDEYDPSTAVPICLYVQTPKFHRPCPVFWRLQKPHVPLPKPKVKQMAQKSAISRHPTAPRPDPRTPLQAWRRASHATKLGPTYAEYDPSLAPVSDSDLD
ncbi:F-box domain-containing protein [Mycena indigotica]|uniref:F-box domain-containing protein n=1 Tax=Mycena indigotica TaxID=2126181 RepID=A0A8H6VW02_9AGAR|nr:F-box domain-containing protein [Mycena indigotica]KAF7292188.1 F-box domain-containing protein [Mycena indigotica]